MKRKMLYCFLLLFVFAVCFFTGCATTRTAGIGNQEYVIEPTSLNVQTQASIDQRTDANISTAIRQKFAADRLLSGSDINIDTTRGRVTLKGKVDNQAKVDRALQLGRTVDGVRSVRTSLTVK